MEKKDVSIILVNYKTKDLTRNCINSIVEKTQYLSYEIFVVDNDSQDGTPEMLKNEFPWVKLIENPQNSGKIRFSFEHRHDSCEQCNKNTLRFS